MEAMDVDQTPPRLTIGDLPNELLFEILKLIQDERGLDIVQEVCRRWYSLIDEWLGRKVSTSMWGVIYFDNPEVTKRGLKLISEIGVHSLYVEGNDENLLEHPPSPLPSFRLPHLLRRLQLGSPLHPDLFNNLVKGTVNLSEFWISSFVLANLRDVDLRNLNFPLLNTLVVCNCGAREDLSSLPNLRTLLRENHFRQLTFLVIQFDVESFEELETLKVLIPFIQNHLALEEIEVVMTFPVEFRQPKLSAYQEDLGSLIRKIKECKSRQGLKRLVIRGSHIPPVYPHLVIWKEFVDKQRSLEILTLNIGPLPNAFVKTISSRNASTLKKLRLNQHIDSGTASDSREMRVVDEPLDCSSFSPLQSLHTLELSGRRKYIGNRHLPPTLTNIFIWGYIPSDDMDHILLHLPNLREVTLMNVINTGDGYGVKLETIKQFIRNRQMSKTQFEVDEAEFPQEGLPNGDPVNPEMLKLRSDQGLVFVLNSNGYYTTTGASRAIRVPL